MSARSETIKEHVKKELRKLFRSMNIVSKKFLTDEKAAGKDFQIGFYGLPQARPRAVETDLSGSKTAGLRISRGFIV